MTTHSRKGFTLKEVTIAEAVLGILVAVALPSFVRARDVSRTRAIQADLVRIHDANQRYALEYNLEPGEPFPSISDLVGIAFLETRPIPPFGCDPYIQAGWLLAPGQQANPDGYPQFPLGDTDNARVHPDYLAAVTAGQ